MARAAIYRRRAAARRNAERGAAFREPRQRILIVAEGTKTEPLYLRRLVQLLRLTSVSLAMSRAEGTDPVTLVEHAIEVAHREADFDAVYVLCDRDGHANHNQASQACTTARNEGLPIELICSDPCFEVWYILHFEYTRAPMSPTQALTRLKGHLPTYEKNSCDITDTLFSSLDVALENSIHAMADAVATGDMCPSTRMHYLIDALRKLRG